MIFTIYKQIPCLKMAALVVQSRFAGLKIEDDDFPANDSQKVKKQSKINTVKKPEPPKKTKTVLTKPQVTLFFALLIKFK